MNTQDIRNLYDSTVNRKNRLTSFVVLPSGEPVYFDSFISDNLLLLKNGFHVVPGSFNPLHDAHKAIFNSIKNQNSSSDILKVFEISLHRRNKPFLSFEDVESRISQFAGYAPLWITNACLYFDKAGLVSDLVTPCFHIGFDTAQRLIEDHGIIGVQGINANFFVNDRMINEEVLGFDSIVEEHGRSPYNMRKGEKLDPSLLGISSTKIRSNLQN